MSESRTLTPQPPLPPEGEGGSYKRRAQAHALGAHQAFGVPFPPLKERFERLEETLQIAHQACVCVMD